MSLLLDALKKTGSAQQKPGSLNEMSLEELPDNPAAASASPEPSAAPAASANTTHNATPRSTGENLFAAKKAPAPRKFRYTLGIIPTALIIGSVLGVAGSIYVWIEIQPPKPMQRVAAPAAVANYTAPAPRPVPPLALPPEKVEEPVVAEVKPRRPAPRTESRVRVRTAQRAPVPQQTQGIQFQQKSENDRVYTLVLSGYEAYRNGDLNTAWQRYREALLKDPKNRDALLGMAAIAQQQHQDNAAVQYYKQVLVLDPRDPVALAGMSTFTTENPVTKETQLKQSLSQSPQSAALHFALGNLYTDESRWSDAQQSYFNAFKIEPGNAQFAFNLAVSLDHMGQGKVAAQYYRQALQLDTSGNAGFDHAQAEHRLNQLLAR